MFRNLDRPAIFFFVAAIVSVGLLAYPLWNYTKFFMALWGLDYTISSITIDTSNTPNIQLHVELLVVNSADYSGLAVSSFVCRMKYIDGQHQVRVPTGWRTYTWVSTDEWDFGIVSRPDLKFSVGPSSNRTTALVFSVNPFEGTQVDQENVWNFLDFVKTNPGEIPWVLDCHLMVSSFLGVFDVERFLSPTTSLG
jgi:hypothetical protein